MEPSTYHLISFKVQLPLLGLLVVGAVWRYVKEKFRWGRFTQEDASDYGSHGSSRWASKLEMKKQYTRDPNGFILGITRIGLKKQRIIHPINGRLNQNIMTFGSPGSGKTSGYVIPNILYTSEQLGHSMILTDPKGELYNLTLARLKELGYEVVVFNLLTGEQNEGFRKSGRYNPLDYVHTTEQAMQLANTIITNTDGEKSSDPFWEKAEKAYLCALILYVKEVLPKEEQHLRSIYNLGIIAGGKKQIINSLFEELPKESEAQTMFEVFKSCRSDNTRTSIIMGLGSRLQHWTSKGVSRLTATSDFDLGNLGRKKTALFILMPDYDTTYNLLPSLLIGQAFQVLYTQAGAKDELSLEVPVRFLIDEMANVAPIYDLEQKITTMRSRGISLVCIFQDLDQLEKGYEKWKTIIASCDTICFLGSNEFSTAEYFSSKLGETTLLIHSKSSSESDSGRSSEGQSVHFTQRRVMTADELQRMDRDKLVVFQAGRYPMYLDKLYYFKEPQWNDLPRVNWVTDLPLRPEEEEFTMLVLEDEEKKPMRSGAK